jgi:preprotein translocase subunit SecE
LEWCGVAFNLVKFMREVRTEAVKTTWPSRKETLQTTGLVLAMVVITAAFFLTVDQIIGAGMRALFGVGG